MLCLYDRAGGGGSCLESIGREHCRSVAPILEELAEEYAGKIDIYKVDTEKEEGLAASFGIRSIPSLLFCPMNGQPQMAKGAMGKADFKKAINEVLLKKE